MIDILDARSLAQQLLADELPRRLRHSAGVAARANALVGCSSSLGQALVAAGWLHDVGYASVLVDTGFHPIDGARHLRRLGVDAQVVNLVAHHSCAQIEAELRGLTGTLQREFPRDPSFPHDELCFCDQTTSPDGAVVDVLERLTEIRHRYPAGHIVRQFVDKAERELVAIVGRVEARYAAQPR
jgi:hypothetical protein